jgi:hypothetical protein
MLKARIHPVTIRYRMTANGSSLAVRSSPLAVSTRTLRTHFGGATNGVLLVGDAGDDDEVDAEVTGDFLDGFAAWEHPMAVVEIVGPVVRGHANQLFDAAGQRRARRQGAQFCLHGCTLEACRHTRRRPADHPHQCARRRDERDEAAAGAVGALGHDGQVLLHTATADRAADRAAVLDFGERQHQPSG